VENDLNENNEVRPIIDERHRSGAAADLAQ
jgi:hypothetical protein